MRGIGGASEALGRRIGISWAATFGSAILVVVLLRLDGPLSGALFVFAVAVLYWAKAGARRGVRRRRAALDRVWLAAVNVAALAAAPELYNLLAALLGGGGLLAAGVVAGRRPVEARGGA